MAMANEPYSAEKELLRLIENPEEAESRRKEVVVGRAITAPFKSNPLASLFRKKNTDASSSPKKNISIQALLTDRRVILRLLFVSIAVIFIYFVVTIFTERARLHRAKNFANFTYIAQGKGPGKADSAEPVSTSEPVVTVETGGRNIFKPVTEKKSESKNDALSIGTADFKLVGISIGGLSEESYAMVQNMKTGITFFLKKGDRFEGMELLAIREDRLIFKSKGKEIELR